MNIQILATPILPADEELDRKLDELKPISKTTKLTKGIKWVNISERKPPRGETVLLKFYGGTISSGRLRTGVSYEPQQDVDDYRCECCGRFGGLTHWAHIVEDK